MKRIKCVDGLDYNKVIFRRDLWNLFRFDSSTFPSSGMSINTNSGYIKSLHIDYDRCIYIIDWDGTLKQKTICYKDMSQLSSIENRICEMIHEFCKVNIRDEQIDQILN